MFPKLTLAILLAACIGAALLTLRQQRLTMVHEMAQFHRRINDDRQATWDRQVRIHEMLHPRRLQEKIAELPDVVLVPIIPEPTLTEPVVEHARAHHP